MWYLKPSKGLTYCVLLIMFLCGGVSTSTAQAAVNDHGILIGDGKIHPYYQFEPRYEYNPGRMASDQTADLVLANRFGLDFDFPSNVIEVKANVAGGYDWYAGLQSSDTKRLSDWNGRLGLKIDINQKGALGFIITESLDRVIDAREQSTASTLQMVTNRTGLDMRWKPGGGALSFKLGYLFSLYMYQDFAGSISMSHLNNMRHKGTFQVLWRFLPKTSFVLTVSDTPTLYFEEGPTFTNASSFPLNVTLGLAGLITPRLSTVLSVGYGDMFMSSGSNLRTVIGQFELGYQLAAKAKIRIGYNRSINPVSLFQHYTRDRAYIGYDHSFNPQWRMAVEVAGNYLAYGADLVNGQTRFDVYTEGNLRVSYMFQRYFVIELVDRLEMRNSDYLSPVAEEANFLYNNIFLRFEIRY